MEFETVLKILILATFFSDIEAVDCGGKAFHCFNSTHFQICVDFGNGISTTIDDFTIQCPPPTECHPSNNVECQIVSLSTSTLASTTINIIYHEQPNDNLLKLITETASNGITQAELNRKNKRYESTPPNNTLASENSSSLVTLDVANITDADVNETVKDSFANDLVPETIRQNLINETSPATTTVSIGADFLITTEIVPTSNDFSTAPTYDVVTQIMPESFTDDHTFLTHNNLVENITNANDFVTESYITETSSDINVVPTTQEVLQANFTSTQIIQKLEPISDTALLSPVNTTFTTKLTLSLELTTEPSIQTDCNQATVPKIDTVLSPAKSEPRAINSKKENFIATTAPTVHVATEFKKQIGYQSEITNDTNQNLSVIPKEISITTSGKPEIYENQNETTYTTLQPILATSQHFKSTFSTENIMNITQEYNQTVATPRSTTIIPSLKSEEKTQNTVTSNNQLDLTNENITPIQNVSNKSLKLGIEPSVQIDNQMITTFNDETIFSSLITEEITQITFDLQQDPTTDNYLYTTKILLSEIIENQTDDVIPTVQTTISALKTEYETKLKAKIDNQIAMSNDSDSAKVEGITPILLLTADAKIDPTKDDLSSTVTTSLSTLNDDSVTEPNIQSNKQMATTKYYEIGFTNFKSEDVKLTTFTPLAGSVKNNSLSITTKSLLEITENTESSAIRGQIDIIKTKIKFNTSASIEPQINSTEEGFITNKTILLPSITSGAETSTTEIVNNLTAMNPPEILIPSFTTESQIGLIFDSQVASMPMAKNKSAPGDIVLKPLVKLSENKYILHSIQQDSTLDILTDSRVISTTELTTEPSDKMFPSQDTTFFLNKGSYTDLNNTKTKTEPDIIQHNSSLIPNDSNINQPSSNYTKGTESNYIPTKTPRPIKLDILGVPTMVVDKAFNINLTTTENYSKLNTLSNNTGTNHYLDYDALNNLENNVTSDVIESTMLIHKNITENYITDSILLLATTEVSVADGNIFDARAENTTNSDKKYEMTSPMQNNMIINEEKAENKYIPTENVDLINQIQIDITSSNETTNILVRDPTMQNENGHDIIIASGLPLLFTKIENEITNTSLHIDKTSIIIHDLNNEKLIAEKDVNPDLNKQNHVSDPVRNLKDSTQSSIIVNPTTETIQIKNNTGQIINSLQTGDVHHIYKATGDTTTVAYTETSPLLSELLTETTINASNVPKSNQSSSKNLQTAFMTESSSMGEEKETEVFSTAMISSQPTSVNPIVKESNGHEITSDILQTINNINNLTNISSPNNDLKDHVLSTTILSPGLIKVIPVNQETSTEKAQVIISGKEYSNSMIMISETSQHISTDQVTKNTFDEFAILTKPYRTIPLDTNHTLPNLTSTTLLTAIDDVSRKTLSFTEKSPVVSEAIAETNDLSINHGTIEPQLSTAVLFEDPLGYNFFDVTIPTFDPNHITRRPTLGMVGTKTTGTITMAPGDVIEKTEHSDINSQMSSASKNKNVEQVVSDNFKVNTSKQQILSTITVSASNRNSDTLALVNITHNDTGSFYLTTPTNTFNTLDKITETGFIEAATLTNLHGVSSTTEDIKQKASSKSFDVLKPFNCINLLRGRYSDVRDCSTFYICIGLHEPIIRKCPNNTVFSEINKQCNRNMSHCIRNKEFMCPMEGRFSDIIDDSVYYICVKNKHHMYIRFKLICQKNYYLDKGTVKCLPFTHSQNNTVENGDIKKGDQTQVSQNTEGQLISSASGAQSGTVSTESKLSHEVYSKYVNNKSSSTSDSNISLKEYKASGKLSKTLDGKIYLNYSKNISEHESEQSKSKNDDENSNSNENFKCSEEGKFPMKKECRKYYKCSENKKGEMRRKIILCDSDELFHKGKKKCVDEESYECKDD